jgi:hypothetical protein
VLRIYYCCEVAVMQPGSDPTQSYYLDIPVSPQMRIRGVTVLSNRGGVAKSIAVSA